jgi:putative Mg2+ transporter-C (MgtC) family protein
MDAVATFSMNIGVALALGAVIGLERQFRQHTAGLRTNALVCLGAALFVSLAQFIDHESSPTRIAAQVVRASAFSAAASSCARGSTSAA